MFNILKAEYKKFFSSLSFKVIIISSILFPLFMAFLYKLLENVAIYQDVPIYGNLVSSFGAYMTAFNPADNYGLLLLIMATLIITTDFSSGTIRNKTIAGYKRDQIYFSSFIFIQSIIIVAVTIYTLLTYTFVGLLLDFGSESLTNILIYYVTAMTGIIVIYSLVQLISFKTKSFGASLGIVLGIIFLFMIIPYSVFYTILKPKANDVILMIFPFLQLFVPQKIEGTKIIFSILINFIYIGGLVYLGLMLNRKSDYK